MRLNIDPDSGVPVYLQIAHGIKRSIALGSLREGEQVPSVREVAETLTVNPNTVAAVRAGPAAGAGRLRDREAEDVRLDEGTGDP